MSALVLFAGPTVEPLTTAEAREHCRIDGSGSDLELSVLIKAARTGAERITRRALITQTWDLYLDQFPAWELHVPKPTLQSVTAITYADSDGVERTLAASLYRVDAASEPGRITPAYGTIWPVTRAQTNAVKVRFVAGYGGAANVPAGIKQWMKLRISHLYDNRGTVSIGTLTDFPRAYVDGLLDDFAAPNYAWTRE